MHLIANCSMGYLFIYLFLLVNIYTLCAVISRIQLVIIRSRNHTFRFTLTGFFFVHIQLNLIKYFKTICLKNSETFWKHSYNINYYGGDTWFFDNNNSYPSSIVYSIQLLMRMGFDFRNSNYDKAN